MAIFTLALTALAAEPDDAFRRAVDLLQSNKYSEAIPLLKEVLTAYPNSQGALWNLGIASSETDDHSFALQTWLQYQRAFPDDHRVSAKLVQAYQRLNRLSDRDREREALLAYRNSLPKDESSKFAYYCRDQFRAGGSKIMAFEFFEPDGPRRIFYRFSVLNEFGKESFFFSLGSYDSTTQIARELGEMPPTARAYHLDKYESKAHFTYGHFNSLPEYDLIRAMVVDALTGKIRPLSSTTLK